MTSADYTGPGYNLGFTWLDCYNNLQDDYDGDNFSDGCEEALALAFEPQLKVHLGDNVTREPAYAVRAPSGGFVNILYLLAYHHDGGLSPTFPLPQSAVMSAHSGDSEFIHLSVQETGGVWQLNSAFLSAHYGATWMGGVFGAVDHSATVSHSNLEWADVSRGKPRIYTSKNKHANYRSVAACLAHPFDDSWASNGKCNGDVFVGALNNLNRNIGNASVKLLDCTGSVLLVHPSYLGTECFWSSGSASHPKRFNGWLTSAHGNAATPYASILAKFHMGSVPTFAHAVQGSILGPTAAHPSSICTWVASFQGGVPPYTYEWFVDGSVVGTGLTYWRDVGTGNDFALGVRGQDYLGESRIVEMFVEVDGSASWCTE